MPKKLHIPLVLILTFSFFFVSTGILVTYKFIRKKRNNNRVRADTSIY